MRSGPDLAGVLQEWETGESVERGDSSFYSGKIATCMNRRALRNGELEECVEEGIEKLTNRVK